MSSQLSSCLSLFGKDQLFMCLIILLYLLPVMMCHSISMHFIFHSCFVFLEKHLNKTLFYINLVYSAATQELSSLLARATLINNDYYHLPEARPGEISIQWGSTVGI